MSAYVRKPLEFKQVSFCPNGMIPAITVRKEQDKIRRRTQEAQSLISQVLMANNGLNPAQKASLKQAKELLND